MRFFLLLLTVFTLSASASIDVYQFDTPLQEQQFRQLIDSLRCPKCQNQNLSGSDAEVAKDLKDRAYRLMKEGKSDEQIRAYLIERYGDFISYRPPLRAGTSLLWFGPFLLLLAVAGILMWRVRRPAQAPLPLSDAERQKLAQLLDDSSNKSL
jgi:cytochrome c-type biogenesis protein CcmH